MFTALQIQCATKVRTLRPHGSGYDIMTQTRYKVRNNYRKRSHLRNRLTKTTTSVLSTESAVRQLHPLRRLERQPVSTRSGVSWSTATTSSVCDDFYFEPTAGGSCKDTGGSLSPAPSRSEVLHVTHVGNYDTRVIPADPLPKTVSQEYPGAGVHVMGHVP